MTLRRDTQIKVERDLAFSFGWFVVVGYTTVAYRLTRWSADRVANRYRKHCAELPA